MRQQPLFRHVILWYALGRVGRTEVAEVPNLETLVAEYEAGSGKHCGRAAARSTVPGSQAWFRLETQRRQALAKRSHLHWPERQVGEMAFNGSNGIWLVWETLAKHEWKELIDPWSSIRIFFGGGRVSL